MAHSISKAGPWPDESGGVAVWTISGRFLASVGRAVYSPPHGRVDIIVGQS